MAAHGGINLHVRRGGAWWPEPFGLTPARPWAGPMTALHVVGHASTDAKANWSLDTLALPPFIRLARRGQTRPLFPLRRAAQSALCCLGTQTERALLSAGQSRVGEAGSVNKGNTVSSAGLRGVFSLLLCPQGSSDGGRLGGRMSPSRLSLRPSLVKRDRSSRNRVGHLWGAASPTHPLHSRYCPRAEMACTVYYPRAVQP
ncbi:hypothetical protein AAFF_G00003330 [Aldrovandia affinis]|uniref:Uncharacterized protein n=1 Tax=Aldrovandia affinis TaxID=143900 RepID=A0AAD7TD82_9TELE|nr:hypothetical protein AAFF_G00003330 [Aldrovandia affinis]